MLKVMRSASNMIHAAIGQGNQLDAQVDIGKIYNAARQLRRSRTATLAYDLFPRNGNAPW